MAARKTLLELTQDILSSMDSDAVNSISDTIEAQQVVDVIEETYYEMIARNEWDYFRRLEQLESVSDVDNPTKIKIPDTFAHVYNLRYKVTTASDTREKWEDVMWLSPEDFLKHVQDFDSSETNVKTVTTGTGVEIYVKTDKMPDYFTTFDNQYIFFDSYDSDEESTVEESRTSVLAQVQPTFTRSDTAVPDIPTNMFPYLLNESKSKCFVNFKQVANAKVEAIARRQLTKLREQEPRVDRERRFVNYGR